MAKLFITNWIARFGAPLRVTTDQGRQFESQLFKKLEDIIGFQRIRTTAYHPQANGLVERFHRHLKAAIMCHSNESWTEALPVVLLGIRTAWKEDMAATTAEMMYGQTLRLPGELLATNPTAPRIEPESYAAQLKRTMQETQPLTATKHNKTKPFVFKDLKNASHVFVRPGITRKALQPPYDGPYKVIRQNEHTVTIDKNGQQTTISAQRVKPAFTEHIPDSIHPKEHSQAPPPGRTRSGRISKQTVRFSQ